MKVTSCILLCFSILTAQTVTKTFQHGVNGYWGGTSVDISSLGYAPNNQNGTTFADGNSDWCVGYLQNTSHGYDIVPLMRFDSLDKYIPQNAEVVSAKLTLTFVQWEKPVRVIGRYLAAEWDGDVYDPSGGVSSPKIGWQTRKTGVPWGGKGASAAGTDFIAGTSFIIPDAQKKIPANGQAVYTVALDKGIVQQWLKPEKNFGFKLETDTVGIHVYVSQHQRYQKGTQPKLEIEYTLTATPVGTHGNASLPNELQLMQNYPNPFNPTTTIGFTLQVSGFTTLKIYDALGREISTLVNEQQRSGNYSVPFNASSLSGGMYFYTLRVGASSITRRMALLK